MGIKNRKVFTVTSPNGVSVFCDGSGKKHKNKQTQKIQGAFVLEQVNKKT